MLTALIDGDTVLMSAHTREGPQPSSKDANLRPHAREKPSELELCSPKGPYTQTFHQEMRQFRSCKCDRNKSYQRFWRVCFLRHHVRVYHII